jgi:hypothetical protein
LYIAECGLWIAELNIKRFSPQSAFRSKKSGYSETQKLAHLRPFGTRAGWVEAGVPFFSPQPKAQNTQPNTRTSKRPPGRFEHMEVTQEGAANGEIAPQGRYQSMLYEGTP